MSIHYDVDEMIRRLEEDAASVVLPEDTAPEFRVVLRNRFVQHAMVRAILTEENRRTPFKHQMFMIAYLVAETLSNVANTFDHDVSEELIRDFSLNLVRCYRLVRLPDRPGDISTSARVPSVRGGHA